MAQTNWAQKLANKIVDGVYFDSINGVAGTDWPIGTPSNPVNNIVDAKAIALARKTPTIVLVHGVITLNAGITGYRFIGNGFSDPNGDDVENWIDLAGFTATGCSFEYINIDFNNLGTLDKCGHFLGCSSVRPQTMTLCCDFINCGFISATTMSDCHYFFNCDLISATTMPDCSYFFNCGVISAATTMSGCYYFFNCDLISAATTMSGCYYFSNCGFISATTMSGCSHFSNCGEADITYDCTGLAVNPTMSFQTGILTIKKLTAAHTLTITGNGLRVTIENTCTAGTINIYGDVKVTDNSAGTTVHRYTTDAKIESYARVPVTVASANLKNSNDTEKTTSSLVYVKLKEIIIGADLAGVRIKFDLKTSNVLGTAYGKIYKNGAAVGAEQTDVTGVYATKSEDLTGFVAGDKIQLWSKISNAIYTAYVENFRLHYDITDTLVAVNNDP